MASRATSTATRSREISSTALDARLARAQRIRAGRDADAAVPRRLGAVPGLRARARRSNRCCACRRRPGRCRWRWRCAARRRSLATATRRRLPRGGRAGHASTCSTTLDAGHRRRARLPPLAGVASARVAIDEDDPERFLDGVAARARLPARGRRLPGQPVARLARAVRRGAGAGGAVCAPARRRIRRRSPACSRTTDWALASSSPERLVSVRGDAVETRPIAGTRPRIAGRRRRRAHPRTGRPSQGARRARDADRPGAQRPRPRLRAGQRATSTS